MIPRLEILRIINSYKTHLIVIILYAILTIILTFPLFFHMDTWLSLGDPAFNTWVLAWDVHSLLTDPFDLFNTNIFYPLTKNTLAFSEHLIANMLVAFPVIVITNNPILAYNIILFLSFIFSGYGMFLLIKYYITDDYSAFIGGVVFAFCTIRFAHIYHLQLLTVQWMPFCLLYLDKFLHKGDSRNLFLLYIFYVLQILSSWYSAFYITISLGVYALGILTLYEEARKNLYQRSYQLKTILFLICIFVAVAPFAYPYIQVANEYGFVRSLDDVSYFSADLGDYFLTPIDNLIYGKISYPFQINRNTAEHSLFPGISALLLSMYGLFLLRRIKFGGKCKIALINISDKIQNIYLIIALIAFILSLGYPLHFFGHILNIEMPYKYLFEYFPGFKSMRVPSRFGIIFMLSLSVLVGYGLSKLIDSKTKIKKNILFFILLSLILIESLYIPMGSGIPINPEIPEMYKYLANEKDDFAIVELPSNLWNDTKYMYYSTYHWKKMVNGYSGFLPYDYSETMRIFQSFPSNDSINLSKIIGVKYVLIHMKDFSATQQNYIRDTLKDYEKDVTLKKAIDDDYLYEINLTISNSILLISRIYSSSGLYVLENRSGIPIHWMQADTIIIGLSPDNRSVNLSLQALSFFCPRTMEVYAADELVASVAVPTSFVNVSASIRLAKGANVVRLHVPEGCERPCDKPELSNTDSRCLSVAVQNISIS